MVVCVLGFCFRGVIFVLVYSIYLVYLTCLLGLCFCCNALWGLMLINCGVSVYA